MADAYGDPLLSNHIGHGCQHCRCVVHAICHLQRADVHVLPCSLAMYLLLSVVLSCTWHLRAVDASMQRAAPCQPVDFGGNAPRIPSFSC